jgi:hypothetical protein
MRTLLRPLAALFATSFLLLAACDKKTDDKKVDDKKAATKTGDDKKVDDKKVDDKQVEPPQPEPTPATAAVLTLGAAKIMEKDKPEEAIELLADGTLKFGPNPDETLKISTDGKISKADGTVVAQVGADGAVAFTAGGEASGVVLSDAGLTMTGPDGKTATAKFLEDGTIAVDPAPAENLQMVAEGCTGPMVKTCALILTMLLFQSTPAEVPARAEVGPAPAVVEAKP